MIVYFIECRTTKDNHRNPIKIGMTKDLKNRIILLQNGNPYILNCLFYVEVVNEEQARSLEKKYHKLFKDSRMKGEWFKGSIRAWKSYKKILKKSKVVDPSALKGKGW